MNNALPAMIKNATSRTRALMDGAIRQVRHSELPDGARSNVTESEHRARKTAEMRGLDGYRQKDRS